MNERILVVDDEPNITRMIKLVLEQTGRYEVRTENLGIKAIEAARDFRPDLMLLDVMMPGMLGSEIAAQMQTDAELSKVKILFLTALVTKEETLKSTGQIGGHEFLAKPISADDLCAVIEDRLKR
jgi:DNA-binding response OmpR family regulator